MRQARVTVEVVQQGQQVHLQGAKYKVLEDLMLSKTTWKQRMRKMQFIRNVSLRTAEQRTRIEKESQWLISIGISTRHLRKLQPLNPSTLYPKLAPFLRLSSGGGSGACSSSIREEVEVGREGSLSISDRSSSSSSCCRRQRWQRQ